MKTNKRIVPLFMGWLLRITAVVVLVAPLIGPSQFTQTVQAAPDAVMQVDSVDLAGYSSPTLTAVKAWPTGWPLLSYTRDSTVTGPE